LKKVAHVATSLTLAASPMYSLNIVIIFLCILVKFPIVVRYF
jgi:uroporphyrinogen-III decarboxylase